MFNQTSEDTGPDKRLLVHMDLEDLNVFTFYFRSKLGFSLDHLDSENRPIRRRKPDE